MKTIPVLILAAALSGAALAAKDKVISGVISDYQCGDNCYLTIKDAGGRERTGLCTAPLCEQWNAEVAMPARFKGRKVRVTVEQGQQFDGEGKVAGELDAFSKIDLR